MSLCHSHESLFTSTFGWRHHSLTSKCPEAFHVYSVIAALLVRSLEFSSVSGLHMSLRHSYVSPIHIQLWLAPSLCLSLQIVVKSAHVCRDCTSHVPLHHVGG